MSDLSTYSLSAAERRFITQAQRLLVSLGAPRIARQATTLGYDADEHAEGWRLLHLSSGQQRSFAHLLAVANAVNLEDTGSVQDRYQALDTFENRWFPRTRNAIRRFVDAGHVAEVEATFFKDLQQQPLGPSVVGSVSRFLERIDGLAQSDAPGAAEALASLRKKGLTAEVIDETRAQVSEAASLDPAGPDADLVAAVQAENAAQAEALTGLRLWFNDWAEVFREAFGYHDLVRLGLIVRRGGRSAAEPVSASEAELESPFNESPS